MMALPRMTGAIRAFGNVADSELLENDVTNDIIRKRKICADEESAQGLTWKQLSTTVLRCAEADGKDATKELRNLITVARDIVGREADFSEVEAGAALLFSLFKDAETVTSAHSLRIQRIFGPFPSSAATKACKITNQIVSSLPPEALQHLDVNTSSAEDNRAEFGENLHFSARRWKPEKEEALSWLDFPSNDTSEPSFTMKYVQPRREKVDESTQDRGIDAQWLKDQLQQCYGGDQTEIGMSITELSTTVFDLLASNKNNDELQNVLFDFLGIKALDLIPKILQNRKQLVSVAFDSKTSYVLSGGMKSEESTRPQYGCQVIVQTEQERLLKKLLRKGDKKEKKLGSENFDEDQFTFNPKELRAQREAALLAASTTPLFGERRTVTTRERYPNVYDCYAEAKQTSAFVGGAKMVLPIGFEREDNKMYEEVTIPPTEKAPLHVGNKLVKIADLDEVAQMAFQNTKTLNRIQSIVFDTAYNSNENLLICAPTGAGKTNIAMLCVLHEIKQHMSEGVIRKDEFKVVYVAPMKALAAEMVANFGQRLQHLGILVKELTGDMQLTKTEIKNTQMLVTTPEKWDVVTRKSTGDVSLTQIVKLLIIDEVHLLHDDRGAVIESLVARTLRQVESSQSMIRIVGLSATLPNYTDVAQFLHVNPHKGLFFFDGRFRPVPLEQTFIGIKTNNRLQQVQDFNTVCYDKVVAQVRQGYQVMVFVHARNETVRTATTLCDMAKNKGDITMFQPQQSPKYGEAEKQIMRSRNKELRQLFPDGFAMHHAGMLRQDRNLVERFFGDGLIRCIVCTATLAWGVNLPAHAVIIKGTKIYDAKKGTFVDLGILDVMQIFGRAGRPQFDKFGHGTILTTHDCLSRYLALLTRQNPIESQFIGSLADNLNAEIALGTVTNVEEGVRWLQYTYLYVRLRCNPLVYGITYSTLEQDPSLEVFRKDLIIKCGRALDKARMVRFDERNGFLYSTDLGRIASHFYIKYDTVEVINEMFQNVMSEDKVLEMVSKAQEFEQIKVRQEELDELDDQLHDAVLPVAGGTENSYGKVNILLQAYVSRQHLNAFSLISDQAYVAQNATRIMRALFEMALRKGWPLMAGRLLELSKVLEKRMWEFEHPLKQFVNLPAEVLDKLEKKRLSVDQLKEMDAKEIGHLIRHIKMGPKVKQCAMQIPCLELDATIQPITRTVLRVRLTITPGFTWNDRIHGTNAEPFWIWVEDPENNHIYHSEYYMLHKKHMFSKEPQTLVFTIPIFEPLPTQYYVRAISDRWLGSQTYCPISFQHLILPERHPPHTELLDLQPLPVTALKDPQLESLYNFTHFNPIQTQIFHTLYHTDSNVLLGAPTGSGKTIAAEIAIFRVFKQYPKSKTVYIAPLKALVRERMSDWKIRIEQKLGKKVVELTGDVAPDMKAITHADLIVTTPEKWDGISRSWQTRGYVKAVQLLIIDEIHLLGDDRGPVLEVIVSRTNFIASHTECPVRVIGLSTALANARDLADWLGIKQLGLFNFRPSVRPVPLEVHIAGFPGKHYCPRMATMNKPTYQAIRTHSPAKPVLVFVSSRRQTRLTALDLIAYVATEDNPKQWLHMPETEMMNIISTIKDSNLKLTLAFGIGLHHAGLHEKDRNIVEELFVNTKIQVLIATSTLAWGVNFPAHLVIVKGTEYYDGKKRRYVDFPITDVLQMMGRAGRPQFDDEGKAVILVHDVKKHFYKKFLYEPFPVESNLLEVLPEHLNAEIVSGTIQSKQDAMDYITWTYFFRRLIMNPSYYGLDGTDHASVSSYLSCLIEKALIDLDEAYCVEVDDATLAPTTLGRIASYYYIHHLTVKMFREKLTPSASIAQLITVLSDAQEYGELPVRHNEDAINGELAQRLPLEVNPHTYDSSHTKTHLLLQAHFCREPLPSSDYLTDTKSVLDQAVRVLQAMLDVGADQGWLVTTLQVIHLLQMVIQAAWYDGNALLTLPHVQPYHLYCFRTDGGRLVESLPELMCAVRGRPDVLGRMIRTDMSEKQVEELYDVIGRLPLIEIGLSLVAQGDTPRSRDRRVRQAGGRGSPDVWIQVLADEEYVLRVNMIRMNRTPRRDSKAFAPRFPKPKDEGWIFVLGEVETKEVIALKRVGYVRQKSSVPLSFCTPETSGRVIYTLYVMSDCYLGLDQQFDICLDVRAAGGQSDDVTADVTEPSYDDWSE